MTTTTDKNYLRGFRQAAGLTQAALAQAVGVPVGRIRAIEQGRTQGPLLALRIGDVLDRACPR